MNAIPTGDARSQPRAKHEGRPELPLGMRLGYLVASLSTLFLAVAGMAIVHENLWLAIISCLALGGLGYHGTMALYRRRLRRGEVIDFEGGSDSLAVPFAGGFGGVFLASLTLGSFVETVMYLLLALFAGGMFGAARFSVTTTGSASARTDGGAGS